MHIEVTEFGRKIISGIVREAGERPVKIKLEHNGVILANSWGIPIPGSKSQTFRFNLNAIWQYLESDTKLAVCIDDKKESLPKPDFVSSPKFTLADLQKKLSSGHIFNEKGGLQLSKIVDLEWQEKMLGLFNEMRAILALKGINLTITYGTLLGAHRNGDFIGHDHDFDSGYISSHTDPARVTAELVEVAETMSRRGYRVIPMKSCIWVTDPGRGVTIDIFHTYFDDKGKLQFPFAVRGVTPFMKADFEGYQEISLAGRKVPVVANTDKLLEWIYGPNWRTPDPGHNWDLDRTEYSKAGRPSRDQRSQIHWTDVSLNGRAIFSSTFAEFISRSKYLRRSVIDLGCGNGRDTLLFHFNQSCVVGVDNSHAAIEVAAGLVKIRPGGSSLSFIYGNVADLETIKEATSKARQISGKSGITLYGRFLLHALTEQEQEMFIKNVSASTEKKDTLALEFRTCQDEGRTKAHKYAERRFVDPELVISSLSEAGFTIAERQEGTGFSPYMNENPHLCRLIAVRQ